MAFDEGLADRIRDALAGEPGLTGKKMFGGYGFCLDGNMCVGIEQDRLVARVPADQYQDLLGQPNVTQFPNPDRPMKGWVAVAGDSLTEDEDLTRWVYLGVSIARSLPSK